ncbi:MAG: T9SS type A sorting domain-containing protein [Bacteroidales bacterium]|nr:T9SS type A sorting domain-containing protein [Bacteroidales bacterium]MCF8457171.1 T9SS type A sorting domain-containing protein [Bacteroidales bacterium]
MKKNLTTIVLLASLLVSQFSSFAGISSPTLDNVRDSVVSVDVVPDFDTACIDTLVSYYYLPNIPLIGVSGEWSCSSSNVVFTIIDSVVRVYPMLIDYVNPDTYTLVWTETGIGFTASDTINVLFAPRPTGKIDVDYSPHCHGFPAMLKADDDFFIVHWDWSDLDGGAVFDPANTPYDSLGQGPFLVRWPGSSYMEEHYIHLITTNKWGCVSEANYKTISEPAKVDVDIVATPSTNGLANGEIWLQPDNSSMQNYYQWIDPLGITWSDPAADHQTGLLANDYWFSANAVSVVIPNPYNIRCTDTFSVTVPDTVYSIEDVRNESANLQIFPNPVLEIATLQFETPAFDDYSIWIFNNQGQLVLHRKDQLGKGKQELKLDLSQLQKGNYSVQIQSSKMSPNHSDSGRFALQARLTKM